MAVSTGSPSSATSVDHNTGEMESMDGSLSGGTALVQRALNAHGSFYFTISSIIHGVVFGFWSYTVVANSSGMDVVHGAMVATTFLVIVMSWHEYVMGVISIVYVPDILDSFLPFLVGAAQILLVQLMFGRLDAWILALALVASAAAVSLMNMYAKGRREAGNRFTFAVLGRYTLFSVLYAWFVAGLLLAISVGMNVAPSAEPITWLALFAVVTVLSGFGFRSLVYWRRLFRAARDDGRLASAQESESALD
jgi:hypothetical protein